MELYKKYIADKWTKELNEFRTGAFVVLSRNICNVFEDIAIFENGPIKKNFLFNRLREIAGYRVRIGNNCGVYAPNKETFEKIAPYIIKYI